MAANYSTASLGLSRTMIMEILASSTVTIALLAIAGWLARNWISARLTADIKLENDSKLEQLRFELQKLDSNLSSFTSAGGHAFTNVHAAFVPRKIEAMEKVWESILKWNELSTASMFVSVLPISWIKKHGSDPSTKQTFETMLKSPDYLAFLKDRNETERERPFLSERTWALYFAFHSFYMSRISKAALLLFPDLDHEEVWKRMDEKELVKESATEEIYNIFISNVVEGTNKYLAYLKEELIAEFQLELSGKRDSMSATENAASILEAAEKLMQKREKTPQVSDDKPLSGNGT